MWATLAVRVGFLQVKANPYHKPGATESCSIVPSEAVTMYSRPLAVDVVAFADAVRPRVVRENSAVHNS